MDDVCVTNADEDNNVLNDLGSTSGGGGYANAYNPIDAGYHYSVDFSMASNSSLQTGGIYGNGYTAYGSYSNPTSSGYSSTTTTSACFISGTLVQSEDGSKAINVISVGDKVWAWDEETGDIALKEVVETYVNETEELVHVFVDGEEIITTPSHPFYSPVKGWTDAVQLRAGDILVLVNGEYVVVEKVQHEILVAPVTVYNFQVEDYHTYYVSEFGVLVHNVCANQSNPGATGQAHHPISKQIENAASANPNLRGQVTRSGWGTIRAGSLLDHLGYQKWHRNFDDAVVSWINRHSTATLDEFVGFMDKLYSSTVATSRFGTVWFS